MIGESYISNSNCIHDKTFILKYEQKHKKYKNRQLLLFSTITLCNKAKVHICACGMKLGNKTECQLYVFVISDSTLMSL